MIRTTLMVAALLFAVRARHLLLAARRVSPSAARRPCAFARHPARRLELCAWSNSISETDIEKARRSLELSADLKPRFGLYPISSQC